MGYCERAWDAVAGELRTRPLEEASDRRWEEAGVVGVVAEVSLDAEREREGIGREGACLSGICG